MSQYYYANILAYMVNTIITYGLGAMGWFGTKTNAELSHKYQTLVTPAGWAFTIWGVIFVAQFLWVVLAGRLASQSVVGYNYVWVCAAQAAWTLCFGKEQMLLSQVFMVAILWLLYTIVQDLKQASTCSYFADRFPFSIHYAWILAATAVNWSVVLVSRDASASMQYAVAVASLAGLLLVAIREVFQKQPDFTVPIVLIWALAGVYAELLSPEDSMVERFSEPEIQSIAYGARVGALIVAICTIFRAGYVLLYPTLASKKKSG